MKTVEIKKKRGRPVVLIFYYIFWAAILILLGALFVSQMEIYNELRADLTRLNADVEREQDRYRSLTYELERLDRDDYIERLARDILGMVRPNEIVFRNMAN
ncbi:MAG: septum formation initiator family protein [Defluviitaleaceae bacterium]|nr:septum formation initiator family protein [Defluviitaleaceae bacterium]